eukprot:scaffold172_cov341-Pavlova_lutheri.AAC.21
MDRPAFLTSHGPWLVRLCGRTACRTGVGVVDTPATTEPRPLHASFVSVEFRPMLDLMACF